MGETKDIWADTEVAIKRLTKTALKVLDRMLASGDDKIAFDAAQDVLDRNPETSAKRVTVDNRSVNVNFDANYLKTVLGGVGEVLSGLETKTKKTVHTKRLDKPKK